MPDAETQALPGSEGLTKELGQSVRSARMKFLDLVLPHRPDLHRYCRSLAGDAWEAEDLVQDTLLRAFAKMGEIHFDVQKPRSYLFRIATNVWIDRTRRQEPVALPEEWDVAGSESGPSAPEVREALAALARALPAQERAAVLLKDVFGLELDEVANALRTSRGAVKAALHRGRAKLEANRSAPPAVPPRRPVHELPPEPLVDAFVQAFNARDLERLAGLLLEDASAHVVGMVQEYGREQVKNGSLFHTIFDEAGEPRAELVRLRGEPLVAIWYVKKSGEPGERVVGDVLRFTSDGGSFRSFSYYYFCPELLTEVGAELGLPVQTNGYRYTPK